jgi:hypothetical protein
MLIITNKMTKESQTKVQNLGNIYNLDNTDLVGATINSHDKIIR